jgi:hypothetical protein
MMEPIRFIHSVVPRFGNTEPILVEAAGVEPASENVTGQETTCLFAFMPQALPWDVRGPRSERTRNASR